MFNVIKKIDKKIRNTHFKQCSRKKKRGICPSFVSTNFRIVYAIRPQCITQSDQHQCICSVVNFAFTDNTSPCIYRVLEWGSAPLTCVPSFCPFFFFMSLISFVPSNVSILYESFFNSSLSSFKSSSSFVSWWGWSKYPYIKRSHSTLWNQPTMYTIKETNSTEVLNQFSSL